MWKKIKIIGLFIGLIFVTVAGFIFGRNSNRRRISDDNGLSDRITEGIDRSEERNREVKSSIDASREHNNRASDRISNAQDKLRSAIEILRAAKNKSGSNMD